MSDSKNIAFMIFSGWPQDGCVLIYAETSNKAKSLCVGGTPFDWEYIHMNSKRMPEWDKYADQVKHPMVDCNEDLPEEAPAFFTDDEI